MPNKLSPALLLLSVFVVIPFFILLAWAVFVGSFVAGIFALLLAPASLVVIFLDLQILYKKIFK